MAERAVRYLREHAEPVSSTEMARIVLSSHVRDEAVATRVLETAFGSDSRLAYEDGVWRRVPEAERLADPPPRDQTHREPDPRLFEPDRVLLVIDGGRPARGVRFVLARVAAVRLRGEEVVRGCGGDLAVAGSLLTELREAIREILADAVPIVHDPPGAIAALERWLEEPIPEPVSLRRLGTVRLGLPPGHGLPALAERLGLCWTSTDDPVTITETLESCLSALRRPGETLVDLLDAGRGDGPRVPWERFAFDRAFLRSLPETAGTYRFLDGEGNLLYVGRSRNLRRRLSSYFREGGRRDRRVERLLRALHRIEVDPLRSDLESVLEEARQIAVSRPPGNVQVGVRTGLGHGARLRSIVILEPAAAPAALRAYLLRDGVLLDRVPIGPRGGGLRRIGRILEDRFFSFRPGPVSGEETPVDVELIARWLATHRDRVVAFDPTHLRSADEVVARLRWFLDRGALGEPDGSPVVPR